ncbi:hypothetical protein [Halovivax limisalsi]|uniref:hypothetical protein n=1 Tax=Halovivax limisalsi TaxID=1453760 RepID=UPI001FFC42CE|nr:hypothetical protein [Halovivax limisalsi]
MSNDPAASERSYSYERTRYDDRWRVDTEGYRHVGSGAELVDSVTITYVTDNR